ncbi:MAG: hypothetical protein ACYS0G_08400 [Planctomycetota bacterium]|jgi:hypothetical protein
MSGIRRCTSGVTGWLAVATLGVVCALVLSAYAAKTDAGGKLRAGSSIEASTGGMALGGCPLSNCVGADCTLTQSVVENLDNLNQVACQAAGNTTPNGWSRCYELPLPGQIPNTDLTIETVRIAVQQATKDDINLDIVVYEDIDGCPPETIGVDVIELCRKSIVVNRADISTAIACEEDPINCQDSPIACQTDEECEALGGTTCTDGFCDGLDQDCVNEGGTECGEDGFCVDLDTTCLAEGGTNCDPAPSCDEDLDCSLRGGTTCNLTQVCTIDDDCPEGSTCNPAPCATDQDCIDVGGTTCTDGLCDVSLCDGFCDALAICDDVATPQFIDVDMTDVGPNPPVVPANSTVIVEIVSVDDGTEDPVFAYREVSNNKGQCAGSYIRTPDGSCGLEGFTDLASIGFPDSHLVQVVFGTTGTGDPIAECGNSILEGCEECDPPSDTCNDACRLYPTGACCDENPLNHQCSVRSELECINQTSQGFYLGDDSTCPECPTFFTCRPDAGSCFEAHEGAGCSQLGCCQSVCDQDDFCCDPLESWDDSCVELAIGNDACVPQDQADGAPTDLANGPDDQVDGYLRISPDVFGSWATTGFGGNGDSYNPVGPLGPAEAAFTNGFFIYSGGTLREVLTFNTQWSDVSLGFDDDASLFRQVLARGVPTDELGADGVVDTWDTTFRILETGGAGTDLNFDLNQQVSAGTGLGGDPVGIITQTYTITNNNESQAISFVLLRQFDPDLIWVGDAGDDSVGTTFNTGGGDRSVFQQEDGDPATGVLMSSPDANAGVYYGGKGGIDPDGEGPGVAYGFGTDFQQWDEYGVPVGWENNIAGVGYDTDGESGALPGGDPQVCDPCDGSTGLSFPIDNLGPLASTTITLTTTYGAGGPAGPPCPWDLTDDGFVGINDLLILLANWGPNPGHPADFNGDDFVGINDLLALLANWGTCPQ